VARLYALGVRLCCPVCGATTAVQHVLVQRQRVVHCAACGARVDLQSVEMRREAARVERDWTRFWEDMRDGAGPLT